MIFKDPTDVSEKLKMLLSTSMQAPSKPGFSYTTAYITKGRTAGSFYRQEITQVHILYKCSKVTTA